MKINSLFGSIILLYAFLWIITIGAQDLKSEGNYSKYKAGKSPESIKTKLTHFISTSQGDTVLFDENFSKYKIGASAASFKTNGTAIVAVANGQKGKWMILQDKATFKLSKTLLYPKRFKVDFDILASGDKITDISPLSFGFAADNSVSDYTSNTGAYVELHYYDANQVNTGSSSPQKFVTSAYDLTQGLNRPMHIKLTIEGEKMAVYLNSAKLADTIVFSPGAAKNFYITAPWEYKNGSRILVSNFRITAIK